MVRPSRCVSGRSCGRRESPPSASWGAAAALDDGFLWQAIHRLRLPSRKCPQDKTTDRLQGLSFGLTGLGPQKTPKSPPPSFCCRRPRSVEALAPALAPLAVHHQADDDEEDAPQQGEEHGEENGDSTHPFFTRTHWKREDNSQGVHGMERWRGRGWKMERVTSSRRKTEGERKGVAFL